MLLALQTTTSVPSPFSLQPRPPLLTAEPLHRRVSDPLKAPGAEARDWGWSQPHGRQLEPGGGKERQSDFSYGGHGRKRRENGVGGGGRGEESQRGRAQVVPGSHSPVTLGKSLLSPGFQFCLPTALQRNLAR